MIEILSRLTDRHVVLIFVSMILLWVVIVFSGHTILLGGEGNFVLNWGVHDSKYGGSYLAVGFGMPSLVPNVMGIETLIFELISKLDPSFQAQSVSYLIALFVLPAISFYVFARSALSATPGVALMTSLLYLYNVFGLTYVQSMNIWNNLCLITVPVLAAAIVGYRNYMTKAIFVTGCLATILGFTMYNPPTFVISCVCVAIMSITGVFVRSSGRSLSEVRSLIFRIALTGMAFVFFLLPWISITLLEMSQGTHETIFTKSWAVNWGESVSRGGYFDFALGILGLIFSDPNQKIFVGLVPVAIIQALLVSFLCYSVFSSRKTVLKILASLMILFGVLAAGSSPPFGFIYRAMMEYIPYFYIFKTPNEKFSIAWLICFAVLTTLWLNEKPGDSLRQYIVLALVCSGLIVAYVFKGISGYTTGPYSVSRWIEIPEVDLQFIKKANKLISPNSAILRVPGGLNYQVLTAVDGRLYSGLDYVVNNTVGREIRPDLDPEIYAYFNHRDFKPNLCSKKIMYIYMNDNEIFWYGRAIPETLLSTYQYLINNFGQPSLAIGGHFLWKVDCND